MTLPNFIFSAGRDRRNHDVAFIAQDGKNAQSKFGPTTVYAANLADAMSLVERRWPGFVDNENLYWWERLHTGMALKYDPLNSEPYVAVLLSDHEPYRAHFIRYDSPVMACYYKDAHTDLWISCNLFGMANGSYKEGSIRTEDMHEAIKFATLFPPYDDLRGGHSCDTPTDTADDWESGDALRSGCYTCWYHSAQDAFHRWIDNGGRDTLWRKPAPQPTPSIRHLVQQRYGMS